MEVFFAAELSSAEMAVSGSLVLYEVELLSGARFASIVEAVVVESSTHKEKVKKKALNAAEVQVQVTFLQQWAEFSMTFAR